MSDTQQAASDAQARFAWEEATAASFAAYHAANPHVYEALKRFALEAQGAGRTRMSIHMLCERLRWYTSVETRGEEFKVNNNWRPFYSRLLMEREPALAGFFETRKAKADAA